MKIPTRVQNRSCAILRSLLCTEHIQVIQKGPPEHDTAPPRSGCWKGGLNSGLFLLEHRIFMTNLFCV